jgi:hypothetical protein
MKYVHHTQWKRILVSHIKKPFTRLTLHHSYEGFKVQFLAQMVAILLFFFFCSLAQALQAKVIQHWWLSETVLNMLVKNYFTLGIQAFPEERHLSQRPQ